MSKIFIIAGMYDQFRVLRNRLAEAMIDENIPCRYTDFVYVGGVDSLRGYRDPWGYLTGTWQDLKELDEIKQMLLVQGSSIDNFIEVEL